MAITFKGRVLLDIGSSTVKVYKQNEGVELMATKSIPFKKNFTPESGIAEVDKNELYEFIKSIKDENSGSIIKTYATAAFRKLSDLQKKEFVDEFFDRTGLYFNIISQELESFYLEVSLVGKYHSDKSTLLVNIGGGSTELIVMYGSEAIERINVDFGIGNILQEFPSINESISGHSVQEVVDYCISKLPDMENTPKIAFYSGGELTYMQLAKYKLSKNKLFEDNLHPSIIGHEEFASKNEEVFEKMTLSELESLMPADPRWMHGARGCSALAQAIFSKYGIETIIPSNANLIDGVVRQEFRSVTLSGSFRKHLDYIIKIRNLLIGNKTEVLSPRFIDPKNPGEEFVVFTGEEGLSPLQLERHHLDSIEKSDALIICDPEGYVGASALIEIGLAQAYGKRIIFVEKPEEFMLNTLPAEVGL